MIHGHEDLNNLTDSQREELCCEIREFLVSKVSRTGGHLASNLGVVELTVAIETVFNTHKDRLVFDVGHQSYVHKLLTGRQADFDRLRQFGGIAGFPKPSESDTDAFTAGHASSSVSIALGMARARSLMEEDYQVVALLGDGAATGGMVYEALNDVAVSREPMIIILNDNAMSIDRNVGGIAKHLSRIRATEEYLEMKRWYSSVMDRTPGGRFIFRITRNIKEWLKRMILPTTIFENMGLTYLGPVNGHDLPNLISLLRIAKDMNRPVVLHVTTQKGKGYAPAEEHPSKFHGIGKFDPVTGENNGFHSETFSETFGKAMCNLAQKNDKVCAITAAMPGGTGLLEFKKNYPKRTFDVGIAEEHAVSMAGGLAKQGMVPVVAIYSTFLQRAYDQIQQDVTLQGLHVVFAVDRAGLVGDDGETHHGVFDMGFLQQFPGMRILCPASLKETQDMLCWAVEVYQGPVAIRYPRGGSEHYTDSAWLEESAEVKSSAVCCHRKGADVTLLTYGTTIQNVFDAAQILSLQGIEATVLRLLSPVPLAVQQIQEQMSAVKHLVIVEEVSGGCGIRAELAWQLQHSDPGCKVDGIDLGRRYITHGSTAHLYRHYGLDGQSIANFVMEVRKNEN